MRNKIGLIIISFGIAGMLELLLVILHSQFPESRIIILLGGNFPAGIIQTVTFFLFFWGLLEIRAQYQDIEKEKKIFKYKPLPEKENWIMSPKDVMELRLKIVSSKKNENYILYDIIKKACNKYRSDKSPGDAMNVVSEQVKINLANSESEQSIIRYVAWAIPSVGFIGTVIGIASSLGYAKEAGSQEGIAKITETLSIAFDTTLLALVLSVILMLFFHYLQEKLEKFHTYTESYIIENLINRIYKS